MKERVRILELVVEYGDVAYAEGREGRTHDTEDCAAANKLIEIHDAIYALSAPPGADGALKIPDNWLPTSENINALPRPVRDYIMRLHANTDPAGELRRAMVAEMERDALRKMIEEAPEVEVEWVERPGENYAGFVRASGPVPGLGNLSEGTRVKLLEVGDVGG